MHRHLIETHSHTAVVSPCGHLSPQELVSAYVNLGYSVLIVTDHLTAWLPILRGAESWAEVVERYYSGYRAVSAAAAGEPLTVLPAFELTSNTEPAHDFLIYGIDERRLREIPDIWDRPMDEVKRTAEQMGALVFQAHPYRLTTPADPEVVDGIEIYNANPRHDSRNHLAARFADEHDLMRISGSDAHQWEDVGRSGIAMPEAPATIDEFVQLYRTRTSEVEFLVPGSEPTRQADYEATETRPK